MPDLSAFWLTLRLAFVTCALLMLVATPIAWWLARTTHPIKPAIEAVVALPLILPPTVVGFYLLLAFNPNAPFGKFWLTITGDTLTFSFSGLVIASLLYSFPFAVQPLQAAFSTIPKGLLEAGASLRASPLDVFVSIVLPLTRNGFLTAIILSFAHTLGEFGIVLMVGGNIPKETRVVSIEIYEYVETLRYAEAHALALFLLVLSFLILLSVYILNKETVIRVPVNVSKSISSSVGRLFVLRSSGACP